MLTDKKVIICGVVKNLENSIKFNVELALETGSKFNKFKLLIYENNSTDNTKEILKSYESNKNIKIICENIESIDKRENNKIWAYTEVTGSDHPCRIEHICNARNKLLEEINSRDYEEYSHVIMIDLDSNGWEISGILDSFNNNCDWDAIFANSPKYYDYYALRCEGLPFGPEITGDFFWKNIPNYNFENSLIPVYSAFNGIGIYKKEIFNKYKYDFAVNEYVKKFYRNYIENNKVDNNVINHIQNKCDKFPYGFKDELTDIFWKSNSGYKGLVICEHVPLNMAMYNNGYKLYINPKMIYFYRS
jgi:hypothetical protein